MRYLIAAGVGIVGGWIASELLVHVGINRYRKLYHLK